MIFEVSPEPPCKSLGFDQIHLIPRDDTPNLLRPKSSATASGALHVACHAIANNERFIAVQKVFIPTHGWLVGLICISQAARRIAGVQPYAVTSAKMKGMSV